MSLQLKDWRISGRNENGRKVVPGELSQMGVGGAGMVRDWDSGKKNLPTWELSSSLAAVSGESGLPVNRDGVSFC